MIAQKRCKGTGKAKGYGCGLMVDAKKRRFGLGLSCCWKKWLLSSKEGQELIAMTTLQVTKPKRELEKAKTESNKKRGLTWILNWVRNQCHDYIKLRDKNLPCISCLAPWHNDFQAGHFYKAELYSQLRFNENNIHGQCPRCNIFLEGNLNPYGINLVSRIGQKKFDELKKQAENCKKDSFFKFDRQKLTELKEYYGAKLQELRKKR